MGARENNGCNRRLRAEPSTPLYRTDNLPVTRVNQTRSYGDGETSTCREPTPVPVNIPVSAHEHARARKERPLGDLGVMEAMHDAGEMTLTLSLPSLVLRPLDLLLLIIAVLLSFIIRKLDKGVAALHVIQNEMGTKRNPLSRGVSALDALVQQRADHKPLWSAISRPVTRAVEEKPAVEPMLGKLLHDSAQRFAECLLDEHDVDTNLFMRACRHYTKVLERIGPFTVLSVRETHSNLSKIETTYLIDPRRFRSMMTMLEEEVSSAMHAPGGVLIDPSAAMGLLWARRGLSFWISLFRPHVERYRADKAGRHALGRPPTALDLAEATVRESGWESPMAGELFAAARTPDATGRSRASSPPPSRPDSAEGEAYVPSALSSPGRAPSAAPPADGSAGFSRPRSPSILEAFQPIQHSLGEAVAAGAKNLTDQLLSGVVSQKGYTEFLRAYEETIAPFNGWLARNTFTLSARVAPDWGELVERLGEDKDTLDEAVHLWSVAVMAVLERMRVMSEVHDLEDMRKTI